jgi:hypothetical protein
MELAKKPTCGDCSFYERESETEEARRGKDTVFSFGRRVWDTNRVERTAIRAKRSRVTSEDMESKLHNSGLLSDPKGDRFQ